MSPNNKHNVSKKELDNLLGQAFLNLDFNNPKNQELMETISSHVLPLKPVSTGAFNTSFIIKLISVLAIITTFVLIYFIAFNLKHTNQTLQSSTTSATPEQTHLITEEQKKSGIVPLPTDDKSISEKIKEPFINYTPEQANTNTSEFSKNQSPGESPYTDPKIINPEDTAYVFPVLTPEEIKITVKQKQKMVEDLAKFNKNKYAAVNLGNRIMGGIFPYQGDTFMIEHFYMQTTEVSNFEYRTFLFDLLLSGQKEDFRKAKPDQNEWDKLPGVNSDIKNMGAIYFSDKKYNHYPVVNISQKGAELYCNWLTRATNSYLTQHGKEAMDSLRLPYEREWVYAATGGHKTYLYPWGNTTMKNERGSYYANFKTTDGKTSFIEVADSYNPNNFGLYGMSGNVEEMVYDKKTRTIITKGGSWNSDFDHLRINYKNKEKAVKSSPLMGFRPVLTPSAFQHLGSLQRDNSLANDKDFIFPVITEKEKKAISQEKEKMINTLIKFDKNNYSFIPMGSCKYKSELVSTQAFYMETTEVTNLEYRTFLFDLLVQGRKEEFMMAKPDQKQWMRKFPYSSNEPMVWMYFSHTAYDEYPVVNISRKGAQLYCDWLTIETNKILKASNKPLMNDVRIPDEYEWAYAASNGKNEVKYANGNPFLRDSKGRYEMNYMCLSKEECRYDTILKLYLPLVQTPKFMDDGGFHTVYGRSYAPNSYGLYCMAGNATEMVTNHKTHKPETKGGSWFSCDYFLEINAEDEYNGETNATPLIGFRPIITAATIK